jgi:hypothetical protein
MGASAAKTVISWTDRPVEKMLTEQQSAQFAMLATAMMKRLGYADRPE